MHYILSFNKPLHASAIAALLVLPLTGCDGPNSSFGLRTSAAQSLDNSAAQSLDNSAGQSLHANAAQTQKRPLGTGVQPTPIPFAFQTVDDPNSTVNRVMAINAREKVVGTYAMGQDDIPQNYTSEPPFTTFKTVDITESQATVATSLSSTRTIGGYVIDPNGLGGIWGFLQIRGLSTLVNDSNEGTGSNAVTEILGLNDLGAAVGFYTNAKGQDVPFQFNIAEGTFTDLHPPGATTAQATGINSKGNVTGVETVNSRVIGFYMHGGTYYQIIHPRSRKTEAHGLNLQDQVVGSYIGLHGRTHGFILTNPTKPAEEQVWQKVDEPNADGVTVITGINNHDAICGWYKDSSGKVHGFVATPK
jgi:hypothetical protein